MNTCKLMKEVVAWLKADKIPIARIWMPPHDNPAGSVNLVLGKIPGFDRTITVSFDCRFNEGNVLTYRNAKDLYFYPPRTNLIDLKADYAAALAGELYAR